MKVRPVTLSARAAEEVRKIMTSKNIPAGYGLRVGIRGGAGCGGAQLMLGFDKPAETDDAYDEQGIQVLVSRKHMMYVIGKQVDFYDADDGRGFTFVDPSRD